MMMPMKIAPALAALVLLAGCAAGPTVTVTATAPAPSASSESAPSPEASRMEFTDADLADMLVADDFEVAIKIKEKKCFGSAGCIITFRIDPGYGGSSELPSSGELEITYKVKGGEDPYVNTFTIDGDGTAHFDSEETIDTPRSSSKLSAVVTDLYWSE